MVSKRGFVLVILLSVLFMFIILASDARAGTACTDPNKCNGGWCEGSYCASYGIACNCYRNGGCILTDQQVSYERHCYDDYSYYYQGCVDNQHPGGVWGPTVCPTNTHCVEPNGQCVSTPPPCAINSVSVSPSCGGNYCSQGENITITISYSGSCPSTSYIQVDAMDEDGECAIQYQGGNIQGMETTCTSSPCTKSWLIPSIPNECKGKKIYAWAAGLYNNPDYQPSHYVTGKEASFPPGFGSFDFESAGGTLECNSCADCSSKLLQGYTVNLTQDILMEDADYSCISSMNSRNFTFDCQGHKIYRTSQPTRHPMGIFIYNGTNITIKNCNVFNLSSGVGIHFSNYTLVINATSCSNKVNDFLNQSSGQGTTGYNNTCDIPYNWKDYGVSGCTYQCAAPPTQCNITNAIITHYCGSDGCSAGENIAMNITVEDMTKCDNLIVNKMEMYATTASQYVDGCDINMVNTTQIYRDVTAKTYYANWTVYVPLGCEGKTVYAKNAKLYNASGIIASKDGNSPNWFGNFTFSGIAQRYSCNTSNYQCYANATGPYSSLTSCQAACQPTTQCRISTANITKYCGPDQICSSGEKIGLNITVASMANCTNFNINKIEIDAYSSGQGGQGGMTGFAVQNIPSPDCIVYMTNSTPIQVQGNRFIANWTVSVSLSCKGKTVNATKAKIYNDSNHLVHNKTGNFGSFTFANEIGGCYCVYNSQQYSCGACITGAPYYCQDVSGQGQIIPKCSQCNNCPLGTTCSSTSEICINGGQQITSCHAQTTNTSCHNDTRTNAFCFWDKPRMLNTSYCEACFAFNLIPKTCFDYKNESACVFANTGLDRCGIGPLCLNAAGQSIPGATNCKCNWNGTACNLNYTLEAGGGQHCNLNMVYSECGAGTCGAGQRDVTYDYSNQTGYTDCTATDTTSCQTCGVSFKPLPFFEWWNVIVVVGLLVIVYVFISKESFRKRFYQKN